MHSFVKSFVVLLVLTGAVQNAWSTPLHVMTVGDLHTTRYSGLRLYNSFYSIGMGVRITNVASDTMDGSHLEAIGERIPVLHPDVIVLFIGMQDAVLDQFDVFETGVTAFLEEAESYSETRPGGIQLLLAGNPPVPADESLDERLRTEYNPWLEHQGESREWVYVDLEARVKRNADWTSLYRDGREFTEVGYDWIAVTIRNQILALPLPKPVPEPATSLPLILCLGLCARRRASRRRTESK